MSQKICPTLHTSKSAFQIYNQSDNQMLVLQIIQTVKEASTLKKVCLQAFAHYVYKVSAFLAEINERPIFVDFTYI